MQHDAEVIDISLEQYRHFIRFANALRSSAGWSFDLFRCRESVHRLSAFAAAALPAVAPRIEWLLGDAGTGLVAVDVPVDPGETDTTNVVAGVGLILGLFGNLGPAGVDELQRPLFTFPSFSLPPFSFHMAAHRQGPRGAIVPHRRALARTASGRPASGAGPALPGAQGVADTPRTVALYNLQLVHPDPGKFIWVPAGRRDLRNRSGALAGAPDTGAHTLSQGSAGLRFELAVEPKARRAILFRHPAGCHARDPLRAPPHGAGQAFIRITDSPGDPD